MKDTDIPIPISAHTRYIIQLLLGPESNTQKQLEELDVTLTVKPEAMDVSEELLAKISADAYEKIDTAVALIDLQLAPVSVSLLL